MGVAPNSNLKCVRLQSSQLEWDAADCNFKHKPLCEKTYVYILIRTPNRLIASISQFTFVYITNNLKTFLTHSAFCCYFIYAACLSKQLQSKLRSHVDILNKKRLSERIPFRSNTMPFLPWLILHISFSNSNVQSHPMHNNIVLFIQMWKFAST